MDHTTTPASMTLTAARARLASYETRTKTWGTATYDSGAERALHQIARALLAHIEHQEITSGMVCRNCTAPVAWIERAGNTGFWNHTHPAPTCSAVYPRPRQTSPAPTQPEPPLLEGTNPMSNPPAVSAENEAEPDDRPEKCPQCGSQDFDFVPLHDDGIGEGPAWLCTNCKWGQWSAG